MAVPTAAEGNRPGLSPRESSVLEEAGRIPLNILASIDIVLVLQPQEGKGLTPFRITGPRPAVRLLKKVFRASTLDVSRALAGVCSPFSPITLSGADRTAAGVPPDAAFFTFAYPLKATRDHFQALLAHAHADPWLFFALLGGFCYFDESKTFIQANALTLGSSSHHMSLVGPYATSPAAAAWMDASGRMAPVTLEELRKAGFLNFAWILPDEQPGGHSLSVAPTSFAGGAFAYKLEDGTPIFYLVQVGESAVTPQLPRAKDGDGTNVAQGLMLETFTAVRAMWDDTHVKQAEAMLEGLHGHNSRQKAQERSRQRLLRLWIFAAPLILTIVLLAIAHAEELLFRILSSLAWFGAFTYMMWVVLHNTAMLYITSREKTLLGCAIATVPFFAVGVEFALIGAGMPISSSDLGAQVVCFVGNWVLLPVMIMRMRMHAFDRKVAAGEWQPLSFSSKVQPVSLPTTPTPRCAERPSQVGPMQAWSEISNTRDPTPQKPAGSSFHPQLSSTVVTAAVHIQSRARVKKAKQHYTSQLNERRRQLRAFSWPIVVVAWIELIGTLACAHFRLNEPDSWSTLNIFFRLFWWVIFMLPSIGMLIFDKFVMKIKFSLAHGFYFAASLYRTCYHIGYFDADLINYLAINGWGTDTRVTFVSVLHIMCFALLIMFAKLALGCVAMKDTFSQLLFPFQFFDLTFLYVFFSLRSFVASTNTLWVVNTVLLQGHLIARNSGTYWGIFLSCARCVLRACGKRNPLDNIHTDPAIKIQFLARVAIQYDIADMAAIVFAPTLVTLFVWRDGVFTLQDSGILVTECRLGNMWLRFFILALVKPMASYIAYLIMRNRMALTLLGKTTLLGKSRLVERLKLNIPQRRSASEGKSPVGRKLDADLHKDFELTEEQRVLAEGELSVAHLDYNHLTFKIVKKSHMFFICVIFVQLVAVFQRFKYAPIIVEDLSSSLQSVPARSTWLYVPQETVLNLDLELQASYALLEAENSSTCAGSGWDWSNSSLAWRALAVGVKVDENAVRQRTYALDVARGKKAAQSVTTQGSPSNQSSSTQGSQVNQNSSANGSSGNNISPPNAPGGQAGGPRGRA
ncbi:hypothetical protein AB1Y20_006297 [Prymnesium parvum]